jgi:hypothetical protein
MFCDLVGSTALSANPDREDLRGNCIAAPKSVVVEFFGHRNKECTTDRNGTPPQKQRGAGRVGR